MKMQHQDLSLKSEGHLALEAAQCSHPRGGQLTLRGLSAKTLKRCSTHSELDLDLSLQGHILPIHSKLAIARFGEVSPDCTPFL